MASPRSDTTRNRAPDQVGQDSTLAHRTDVSDEERRAAWAQFRKKLAAYRASPEFKPIGPGEAVARVRALRDEWD